MKLYYFYHFAENIIRRLMKEKACMLLRLYAVLFNAKPQKFQACQHKQVVTFISHARRVPYLSKCVLVLGYTIGTPPAMTWISDSLHSPVNYPVCGSGRKRLGFDHTRATLALGSGFLQPEVSTRVVGSSRKTRLASITSLLLLALVTLLV